MFTVSSPHISISTGSCFCYTTLLHSALDITPTNNKLFLDATFVLITMSFYAFKVKSVDSYPFESTNLYLVKEQEVHDSINNNR